jgi:hypothetical protein
MEIEKLKLLLGGDHGKGTFTFLFVIVFDTKTQLGGNDFGTTAWPD